MENKKLIVFICNWDAYHGLETAGAEQLSYDPRVIPIRLTCMGRISTGIILKAFEQGAMGVLLLGCPKDDCRYDSGIRFAEKVVVETKKILNLLREYFRQYKPQKWLFERSTGIQFPKRTIQKYFQKAVIESGINKPATLTILKNSFAIHLIEKGVDIRYIQQMLGHKNSKTTMKYLKVSKRDLSVIQSPLDNLDV